MAKLDRSLNTPRERILAAAIEIIERDGPTTATTRAIATAAGVNVAAINYYFHSKEALFDAALGASWEHTLQHLVSFLEGEPWDRRAGLLGVAGFLLEGGYRFPAVTRVTIFNADGSPRLMVAASVVGLQKKIVQRLLVSIPGAETLVVQNRVGAFIAAVVFPPLFPTCYSQLSSEGERERYVVRLVDDLLASFDRPLVG